MPSSESSENTSRAANCSTSLYVSVPLRDGGVDKNRNEREKDSERGLTR